MVVAEPVEIEDGFPARSALLVCLAGVLAVGVFATGHLFRDREAFTRYFVQEENYCFNDEGFVVISQLNRYRSDM